MNKSQVGFEVLNAHIINIMFWIFSFQLLSLPRKEILAGTTWKVCFITNEMITVTAGAIMPIFAQGTLNSRFATTLYLTVGTNIRHSRFGHGFCNLRSGYQTAAVTQSSAWNNTSPGQWEINSILLHYHLTRSQYHDVAKRMESCARSKSSWGWEWVSVQT